MKPSIEQIIASLSQAPQMNAPSPYMANNPMMQANAQPMGLLAEAITTPPINVSPEEMQLDYSPEIMEYLQNSTADQQAKILQDIQMQNQTPIIDPLMNFFEGLMQGNQNEMQR